MRTYQQEVSKGLVNSISGEDGGTLLVSPHSDDAVMAAGHILRMKILPEPLYMVTVFSWSFHLAKDFKAEVAESQIPKLRLDEDKRFCKSLGIQHRALGLHDIRHSKASSEQIKRLKKSLLKLLRQIQPSIVLCGCPQPTSNLRHTHHVMVFKATCAVVGEAKGTELFILDDQPYSRLSASERITCNDTDYIPLIFRLGKEDFEQKVAMMKVYKSQMKASYFHAIKASVPGDYEKGYSETLWLPQNNRLKKVIRKVL